MRSLEFLRNKAFWASDALRKGPVKKHYKDISDFFLLDDAQRKQKVSQNLSALLNHAVNTCSFYKSYKDYHSIDDFPVIDKTTIRSNYDNFISRNYLKNKLIKLTTSGSTGTPFQVYQDINKKARNTADTLYFAAKTNYDLGQKLYYLKIWSDANRKNSLVKFMQNVVMVDVVLLDDQTIDSFLTQLRKEPNPFGIIGYASAIEQICKYLDRKNIGKITSKLASAITISESLSQETKNSFKKHFDVSIVSRYSNIENGIIAQQCFNSSNEFHVNTASYLVEILDMETDSPVKDGQLGRIVVTDYFNFGMPLIRYDTGDIGSIDQTATCEFKTPVFTHLEGRKLDLLYNTSGHLVSSLLVYKNMWKYTEIVQYQLIQTGRKNYTLKINIDGEFLRSEQIINEYKSFLGEDAHIFLEFVSNIPLLSSGKRKKVVNEYYQQK